MFTNEQDCEQTIHKKKDSKEVLSLQSKAGYFTEVRALDCEVFGGYML